MTRSIALLPVLLLLAGCGSKLKLEETFDLPVSGKVYAIDPISSDQKVTISVKASEGPVEVSAYTEKQKEFAERSLFERGTNGFLGRELGKQDVELQVDVPAGEKLYVNIQRAPGRNPKSVTVRITN